MEGTEKAHGNTVFIDLITMQLFNGPQSHSQEQYLHVMTTVYLKYLIG